MKFTCRDLLFIVTFVCLILGALPVLAPFAEKASERFWKSVTVNPTTYRIARSILE